MQSPVAQAAGLSALTDVGAAKMFHLEFDYYIEPARDGNHKNGVSTLDLVEIRKLILGLYTEFPKNASRRFVDAGFEFVDPNHPWPFDEVIESHSSMTMQADFIGVKVGDVNGTVAANALVFCSTGAESGTEFALYQNEPNPFSDQTVIGFGLWEQCLRR